MPSLYLIPSGALASSQDINQLVNTLTGNQNTPTSIKNTDPIAFTLQLQNTDPAGKTLLIYGPDGTTVILRSQGNGVVASPDGTAGAPVVTTTHTQTLTNKTLGSNTLSLLAGQNNTLTVPACRVYNSAAISLGSGTSTTLTFDTERYKTDAGMHSTSVNTGRLVATVAGKHRISGHAAFAAAAGGTYRLIAIRLNGVTYLAYQTVGPLGASTGPTISVATTWHMAVGDYVELIAVQDSGAALNVQANPASSPEFSMEFAGT